MTALHVLEELAAGWLLAATVYAIGWALAGIVRDVRGEFTAGRHERRTPEPARLTLVAAPRPRLFDQDAVA